jgi:hypothetical protein
MPTVHVYGFTGKYTGSAEYDYRHPELGATHKCMLFLSQERDESEWDLAGVECRKYGFSEVSFSRAGKLVVDALNTDTYRGFAGFYEEALEQGSALVFYPNT